MEELVTMYAMLANRGVEKPLRYRQDDAPAPGARLLSEEASFMVLDILRDNPRPDNPDAPRDARLPVAWKTGTSWGFRDAWSVGQFGPYVLAVWIGNFDGSGWIRIKRPGRSKGVELDFVDLPLRILGAIDRSLDDVPEFPHVTGPGIGL